MKQFCKILFVITFFVATLIVGIKAGQKAAFIQTADIVFSRCKADESMWCLTLDQYGILIQQLSARKECTDESY